MFATGNWTIPTVNGDLYTDKPILYFWLVLLFSHAAGSVNEWTVRLPAALGGIGLVVATYFLGRDFFGARAGFLSAVILATSARVLWESRWAHLDMPLSLFLTLALFFFWRGTARPGAARPFYLAYAFMALATLTKGLIGFVLPGLILLAFVTLRREWSRLLEWRIPSGAAIFLAVAGPWFAWVTAATGGRWLAEFVWVHHVKNYAASFGHEEPLYYYFINLPADFLPWSLFALPGLWLYRSKLDRLRQPGYLFLFLWAAVIFLFFSLSESKRGLYLLPLFPPLAIFTACFFEELIDGRLELGRFGRILVGAFFAVLGLAGAASPAAAWLFARETFWLLTPLALFLAAASLFCLLALVRRRPARLFYATAATTALAFAYVAVWILPFADRYKSPRPFAAIVRQYVPSDQPLFIYADGMHDFNYYLERESIPVLASPSELREVAAGRPGSYLLLRERDLKRLEPLPAALIARGHVGGKSWYLMRFGAESREDLRPMEAR